MINRNNLLYQELPNPPRVLWDETPLIEKLNAIKANPTAQYTGITLNPTNLDNGATYETVFFSSSDPTTINNTSAYVHELIVDMSYITLGSEAWVAIDILDKRYIDGAFTLNAGSQAYLLKSGSVTANMKVYGDCYLSNTARQFTLFTQFTLGEGANLYFDDYGKTLWQVFDTYNFYGNIYCNTLSEQKNYLEPLFNGFGNTYIGQVISDVVVPNNTTSQVTINWLVDSTLSIPLAVKDKIKIIRKTGSSQIIYT